MRFLSSDKISEDVPTISECCRRHPKMIQRFPNINKEFVSSSTMRSDMVWRIQTRHIHVALFIRIYFLALVQVYTLFESVSVKAIMTQIFKPGVRNWSVSMSVSWTHEIEVFDRQA